MALIKRLRRITAARIETFLSTVEDPEHALPQLVREMEKQAATAGQAVAKALTAVRGAHRRLDETRGRIVRLEKGAALALEQGDEQLAREALAEIVKTEKQEKICGEAVAEAQRALDDAREARTRIGHQLENLKADRDGIIARSRALKIRQSGRPAAQTGSRHRSLLDYVAAIETSVDRDEAEIEISRARREHTTLEERLKDLERRSEIDQRVRQIKRRREET